MLDDPMPKIIIDDKEIEVAPETTVIEAAAQLDIIIPRFCYHPALGSVGACRVCAVKFLQGPFKGVQMSCMIEAQDGMVVSTTDKEAVDFRKSVIEWLMLHHPHDCPVCDEGGHCLLQDMTVSGGHGIRRYLGPKRTYPDQYLGPLIQHEMNRCIHCYRCSRFYQEFAGFHDLGVMRNANNTYFGRFEDGILESPFTGNLSDICPTGVYTDKPSRYFGRRWDYQRNPSFCINCSLGCQTVASIKYREIKRQEARYSEKINGYFICDRGRYGFFYGSLKSRPRNATIDGKSVSHDQAVKTAFARLEKASRASGAFTIAAMGSTRSSLETQGTIRRLCQLMGWRNPSYFIDPATTLKVKTAIARLESRLAVSLREIEKADFILCVGTDPINEAPMMALAMRQAQRNGAQIVVMDPRPVFLPVEFKHLPTAPEDLSALIGFVIKASVDRQHAASYGKEAVTLYDSIPDRPLIPEYPEELISEIINGLKQSHRPVIVSGTEIATVQTLELAADLAVLLQSTNKKSGLFYLLPGANAFGAGLLSDGETSMLNIIEAIEHGDVKALILVESDPFFNYPDRKRLKHALDALDLLIVLDYLDSNVVQKAHIFIPSTTFYESDGIFVNQEGRAQLMRQAYNGGVPVIQSGGGDHPPRKYGTGIPGTDPKPAWQSLIQFGDEQIETEVKTLPAEFYEWLVDMVPFSTDPTNISDIPTEGMRLGLPKKADRRFTAGFPRQTETHVESTDTLKIVFTDLTFGTEELSSRSECLWELEPEPVVFMHTSEAQTLDLKDDDLLSIQMKSGNLVAKLKTAENMAAGVLIVPRHRKISWQIFEPETISVARSQIKKGVA